jgi:hypothetical protein
MLLSFQLIAIQTPPPMNANTRVNVRSAAPNLSPVVITELVVEASPAELVPALLFPCDVPSVQS